MDLNSKLKIVYYLFYIDRIYITSSITLQFNVEQFYKLNIYINFLKKRFITKYKKR